MKELITALILLLAPYKPYQVIDGSSEFNGTYILAQRIERNKVVTLEKHFFYCKKCEGYEYDYLIYDKAQLKKVK